MKGTAPIIVCWIMMFVLTSHSFGQAPKKNTFIPRKNVIRYNLTPNILGFNSVIFGYERVIKPYQSFSVNAGYLSIGNSGKKENENYKITNTRSRSGLSIAVDYRFYLKRENKDPAPHGVYIAPYYAFYGLNLGNTIQSLAASGSNVEAAINTKIRINNLGVELGYQFNIKNRFTIDMILIGPSYSSYWLKMDIAAGAQFSESEIDEKLVALKDILLERYPWLQTLIEEGKIDVRGRTTHWGFGFRYVFQIGYRF